MQPKPLRTAGGYGRYEILELGAVVLRSKQTIRNATISDKTYGKLSADRSDAIAWLTLYSSEHYENDWRIGPKMAFDPGQYFIIPHMVGSGPSSAPSNRPTRIDTARLPKVTAYESLFRECLRSTPSRLARS